MLDWHAPQILLLAQDAAVARQWATWLKPLGGQVWHQWGSVPADAKLDVIVTDGGQSSASAHGCDPTVADGRAGLIVIGDKGNDDQADVWLEADVSARELQLACRLLTSTVRLARQIEQLHLPAAGPRDAEVVQLDLLTGLPDRRAWRQEFASRSSDPARAGSWLCVAVLDLDHFKQINDGWGLPAGDRVLAAVGRAMREGLRDDDFVARLGGDEFGLLLSLPDDSAAASVLERIRGGLSPRLAQLVKQIPAASVGYCVQQCPPCRTLDQLYEAACRALRRAKQQGRDRAVEEMS